MDDAANTSDEAKIAKSLWAMFGADEVSANAWLAFAEIQVRSFVASHAGEITRLADVVQLAGSLSADAVARLLDEQ